MRKLTYFVASTIDGYIAGPDGSDPSGPDGIFPVEGDHIDAIFSEYPEIAPGPVRKALGIEPENSRFDTALEGRRSYEIGLKAGITNAYPHLRHYVFSRSMARSPDPDVEIVSTDPIAKVRELKQEDGKGIWLCGGAQLADALSAEIDELIVKLNPVVIGSGIPLFAGDFAIRRYELAGRHIYASGVAFLTYVPR
ncbi:MAG: dihydrofolate reductase [Streptosporangiales bacterium]|nr:dihydrofolate reductase [Streptosporangiales bacterium]